ncbi:MAG: hypothetical protein JWP38_3764 [Herbaspirillum sp.]|nr:hypothetical protein [Herbaspirillum sp.]
MRMVDLGLDVSYGSTLKASNYRPDIDGLRALAVLSVIGFHAFPDWIGGGFIGVDMFFVISGYLISLHIFQSLSENSFSFFDFYSRRIRRIFPALIIVLLACLVTGWFVLLPAEYRSLGRHAAGGAGFISNLLYWQESGYFDGQADYKPLLHLWSLGVEEQFYIVWPILLWCAWKLRFNLLALSCLIAFASFAYSMSIFNADSNADFYSPMSRIWELLGGAIIAHLDMKNKLNGLSSRARNLISIASFATLLAGILFISQYSKFPGYWALIPVIGAVGIIVAGPRSSINRLVFTHPIAIWVGLISFPLYLWHWPLLSFARIIAGGEVSILVRLVLLLAAVFLSYTTVNLVETKLRFGNFKVFKAAGLLISIGVIGSCGYKIFLESGFEGRTQVAGLERVTNVGLFPYPGEMSVFEFDGRQLYQQRTRNQQTTLFIGDSNMQQYYVRVKEILHVDPETSASVIFAAEGGCYPIDGVNPKGRPLACNGLLDTAYHLALENPKINRIVIGGLWTSMGFLNGGTLKQADYISALHSLGQYLSKLKSTGKEVFLILPIPSGKGIDPHFLIHRDLANFPNIFSIKETGTTIEALNQYLNFSKIRSDIISLSKSAGVTLMDPLPLLCHNGICHSMDENGVPMYLDGGHLNPDFVMKKASFLDPAILIEGR